MMYNSDVGYYCHQQPPPPQQPPQMANIPATAMSPVLCLICNSRKPCPSVRSKSATICEACKKFFLRHRDVKVQQALQCATGRHDCDVTVTAKRPCSACRLAKCFSIGMRFEDYPMRTKASKRALGGNSMLSPSQQRQLRQQQEQQQQQQVEDEYDDEEQRYGKRTSPTSSSQDSSLSPTPPPQDGSGGDTSSSSAPSGADQAIGPQEYDDIFDLTAAPAPSTLSGGASTAIAHYSGISKTPVLHGYAEEFLRKSLRALTELAAFETLPLRQQIGDIPDENAWWQLKMQHFQAAARSATAYVRQLPAFTTIPIADRPVLFANALYPLLIADLALPSQPRGLSFLGMNERNRAEFLRYFSEFQMLSEDTNRITEVFSEWGPTMFEFAILAALLFYEPCFPGLHSTEMVRQVNDQLKNVLHIYLPQHCANPKQVTWRLQQFEIAFAMLRRASVDHCIAIEMLARRRPGFESMNELFYEVFTHTQQAVTMLTQKHEPADAVPAAERTSQQEQHQLMALQPIQKQTSSTIPPPLYPMNNEPFPPYQQPCPEAVNISGASYPKTAFEPAFTAQFATSDDLQLDSCSWQAPNVNY